MSTTTPRRSFMMAYRAEDFPLYLLGLVLSGVLIVPALPYRSAQVALVAALAYLTCFFLIKHGAKLERTVFRTILDGVKQYPAMLLRSWSLVRSVVIPKGAIFALAVTAEYFLRSALVGTIWVQPFPWQWVAWGSFLVITLFRLVVAIAHLLRSTVVREVLESSPQRKMIAILSIRHHIVHGFVTGVIAHLSLLAPCVLFYMWTDPSILRETFLLGGFLVWTAIARPLRKRKILDPAPVVHNRMFYHNHVQAHQSRFFFTVFHGHHHDAIPSAVITGAGFLENSDRAIAWLDPLGSIIAVQVSSTWSVAFDMVVHQYIPGVFPFVKPTFLGAAHHISHHYGSGLPLGILFSGYIEPGDVASGYKPDNAVTRWFVAESVRRERIDPELTKAYLSLPMKATYTPAQPPAVVHDLSSGAAVAAEPS